MSWDSEDILETFKVPRHHKYQGLCEKCGNRYKNIGPYKHDLWVNRARQNLCCNCGNPLRAKAWPSKLG